MSKEKGSLELKCQSIIPRDKMPKSMLHVLDETGDTTIEWDRDDDDEIAAARKMFKSLMKIDGTKAYKVAKDGGPGIEITKFNENISRILVVPQIAGG